MSTNQSTKTKNRKAFTLTHNLVSERPEPVRQRNVLMKDVWQTAVHSFNT